MSGVFEVDEESYDDFMGRYSVRLAPLFADFAGVRAGQRVLDVGAGTGALTRELVVRGATVVAVEPSPEFTRALRVRFPMIEVRQTSGEELPFADGSFDTALAQLVVAFMTDAGAAMSELGRVARQVAICMWGVDEVQMFAGGWLHSLDSQLRALAHDELHRQLGCPGGAFGLRGRAYGARGARP